jgi:hypothetical protein
MPETKTVAADPEIPDELRSKLATKKRPGGFVPRAGDDAEDDNAPEETETAGPLRDLRSFFKKLKVVLAKGEKSGFFTTVTVMREERTETPGGRGVIRRFKETVDEQVQVSVGENGLPYPADPVSVEEAHRICALKYADAPAMDGNLGDLTPQFVEWLYLNHPYDAAVRYSARNTHVQVAVL